jgi:hypothetical protein
LGFFILETKPLARKPAIPTQKFDNPGQITDAEKNPVKVEPQYDFSLDEAKDLILASQQQGETEYTEIRKTWTDCWDAYRMYQDTSKKKKWQSKVYVPELYPAVKKAVSLIKRLLLRARKIFDIQDPLSEGQDSLETTGQEVALEYWLNIIKWINTLTAAIESGLVFGIWIVKLWWEPKDKSAVELSRKNKIEDINGVLTRIIDLSLDKVTYESSTLACAVIDPRKVWFDQAGTFFIEESSIPLWQLEELSKPGPNGEVPLYDADQVKLLKDTDYGPSSLEIDRLRSLNIVQSSNKFQKMVHLYEYHGPHFDIKGKLIKKKAHLVLANKQYILNPHRTDQPFNFFGTLEGSPPYIKGGPIEFLFRNEGVSMIEGALSLQKAINGIMQMSMDGLLWKLNKMFQVNPDDVRNPDVLTNLAPGRPVLSSSREQIIREIQISDVPNGSFAIAEILKRATQNADFVSDFLLALGSKADTTATEVQVKTSEANSMWEGISRTIEDNLIVPFIEMARQLMILYWDDFRDPVLQEISKKYGLPFNSNTREERIAFLLKNVKIRSQGVSSYFQKMEELKLLIDFLGVMAKIPNMPARLNLKNVADRIIGYFSFQDPQELVISDEEEKKLVDQERQMEISRANNLQSQANLNNANVQGMQGGMPPGMTGEMSPPEMGKTPESIPMTAGGPQPNMINQNALPWTQDGKAQQVIQALTQMAQGRTQ